MKLLSRSFYFSLRHHSAKFLRTAVLVAGVTAVAAAGAAEPKGGSAAASGAASAQVSSESTSDLKANLIAYVSRAYQVPKERISQIIDAAIEAGRKNNLDPLLLLSITAAESTFNPLAKNRRSGASGLMQIMPNAHSQRVERHGGEIFDIHTNMQVGSELLRDMIDDTGSLQRGLKSYVGVGASSTDGSYGNKITREHSRLRLAAEGDVNQAVRLKRALKPAESISERISGTFSEFKDWLSGSSSDNR